jgi:hypothetical protein
VLAAITSMCHTVRRHAGSEIQYEIRRVAMNFIERILGISPDGGTGTFEFLLFLIPLVGVWIFYEIKFMKSKRSK